MLFPPTVVQLLPSSATHDLAGFLSFQSWASIIFEVVLMFAFTFFYIAVVFNPIEQADNLKKYGGFIPASDRGGPPPSTWSTC